MKASVVLLVIVAVAAGLLLGYTAAPVKKPAATPTLAPLPQEFDEREQASLVIPAVDTTGQGRLAEVVVELEKGTGKIFVGFNENNPVLNDETQESLKTAVSVAKRYALRNPDNYDLHYSMNSHSSEVGGGSAGAAFTIATMAVLQGRKLRNDTAVTGTVLPDGSIGRVGGVLEKARAVKAAGFKRLVVPLGEAWITEMREKCEERTTPNSAFRQCTSAPINVSVAQQAGIEVIEASRVLDAFELTAR